ncbi:unnamed protein product, partial [Porites lobata]
SVKILLLDKEEPVKGKGEPMKCAASDQADLQSRKRKAQAQPDFVEDSSEDSGDEFMKAEQDKVAKLLSKLGKKASTPIANIPAQPTCTAPVASQLEKKILHLEREVQEMKASLENIKEKLSSTVPAATCSPNHSPSGSNLHGNEAPALNTALSKPEFKQELGEGILFQSRRSNKPPLDEARVSKMF